MADVGDINYTLQDLVRAIGTLAENVSSMEAAFNTAFPLTTVTGSKTFDPPSIAAGAQASTTVSVVGAILGQFAVASFSLDLALIQVTAYVSAPDVVTVVFRNGTAGAIDLASGTLAVRVFG